MLISQKCQYALSAVLELALRNSAEPAKVQTIAAAQGIPPRFLEVILSQLRHGGFVESRRGKQGGYVLARDPDELTVGEVIRYLQGPINVASTARKRTLPVPGRGDYAFGLLWDNVKEAVTEVYDQATFAELVEQEISHQANYVPNYAI